MPLCSPRKNNLSSLLSSPPFPSSPTLFTDRFAKEINYRTAVPTSLFGTVVFYPPPSSSLSFPRPLGPLVGLKKRKREKKRKNKRTAFEKRAVGIKQDFGETFFCKWLAGGSQPNKKRARKRGGRREREREKRHRTVGFPTLGFCPLVFWFATHVIRDQGSRLVVGIIMWGKAVGL
jgi:hypothetical protein